MRRGDRAPAMYKHLESATTEGAPAAEDLPKEADGIGDLGQTTETTTRSPLATVYA